MELRKIVRGEGHAHSSKQTWRKLSTFVRSGLDPSASPTVEAAPRWNWGHRLDGRTLFADRIRRSRLGLPRGASFDTANGRCPGIDATVMGSAI